jgi:type VI secretion system protein ImpB
MSDSGQKFIRRNRAPRVHITYEDPSNAEKLIELPFVMGVMADLSGNAPGVEKPDVAQRKFLDVDMDNFENRMAAIQPGVNFRVRNKLGEATDEKMQVGLRFNKMDDFKPAQVARQVPALAKLLEARDQLKNLQLYMDGKADAEKKLRELLKDPALMAALQERASKKDSGSKE